MCEGAAISSRELNIVWHQGILCKGGVVGLHYVVAVASKRGDQLIIMSLIRLAWCHLVSLGC